MKLKPSVLTAILLSLCILMILLISLVLAHPGRSPIASGVGTEDRVPGSTSDSIPTVTLPPETLPSETVTSITEPPQTMPSQTESVTEPSVTTEPTTATKTQQTPYIPSETLEDLPDDYSPVTPEGYGLVPQSKKADKSYFDDAAFVGDSISLKLSYYNASTKALGGAQFFTAGSMGASNALWEVSDKSCHPSYQGTKMLVEDCIQQSGAKKVYLMLGMNDIGLYGLDTSLKNYKALVARIKEKSPDVTIFVQSMTPMASTSHIARDSLNNIQIQKYNRMLLETCKEMGWYYIDVGSVMYDENGEFLEMSFCSDPDSMGIHFTSKGCAQWVDYLLTHTVDLSAENGGEE